MGDFQGHPFRGNQWTDGQGGGLTPDAAAAAAAGGVTLVRGGNYGPKPWSDRTETGALVQGTGQGLRPSSAPPVDEDPEGDARAIAAAREDGVDLVPDGDGVPLSYRAREAGRVSEDIGPYGTSGEGSWYYTHDLPGSDKSPLSSRQKKAGVLPHQGPLGELIESEVHPTQKITAQERRERVAAREAIGRLSGPSKMPCLSWSIPPDYCHVGSTLAGVQGTACEICYARKGSYVWKSTKEAMQRRYDTWKKMPDERFVDNFAKALKGEPYFRWFDSGDVQGERMLKQIVEIARRTPDTQHWLPTKEAYLVEKWMRQNPGGFPKNLQVRVSIPKAQVDPEKIFPRSKHPNRPAMAGILKEGASCPASHQGGNCGRCRRCWSNKDVTYKQH